MTWALLCLSLAASERHRVSHLTCLDRSNPHTITMEATPPNLPVGGPATWLRRRVSTALGSALAVPVAWGARAVEHEFKRTA